jgi:hypothetical protein
MAAKDWLVRGVDEATKKIVRMYALEHDMSIAEALVAIVAEWKSKK